MAALILTVRITGAALRETGDAADRVGDNVVNVALLWPRAGKAEVFGSTGSVPLTDHADPSGEPDRPPLFDAPVVKEVVEGDVTLLVHVLERDRTGAFEQFVRNVGAAALRGAGRQAATLAPGLVREAFTEAADQGAIRIRNDDGREERLEVVAVAERPVVVTGERLAELAASGEAAAVHVELRAPRELARAREKGRLAPGRPNGWLELELRVHER